MVKVGASSHDLYHFQFYPVSTSVMTDQVLLRKGSASHSHLASKDQMKVRESKGCQPYHTPETSQRAESISSPDVSEHLTEEDCVLDSGD